MTSDSLLSGHQPLDEVLGGGLPANGITVIMGLPGSGKTIIAQQYTFCNARPDRPAVYFSTLSEPLEKIVRFGQTLDFFDTAAIGQSVFYQDLGQAASQGGLAGVGDHIADTLKQRRPGLVVIDSFKALHALAGSDAEFRAFLHQLAGRLTAFPAASLWVGEYSPGETATAPEFAVADAIIELAAVPLGQREQRRLRIHKRRGSGFLPGQHGYRLTAQGLRLFPRLADVPPDGNYDLGQQRVSTGLPGLDAMLGGGGLWPGTATIIAGPSGAGKTIMGMHFAHAGAGHGEHAIFATFQENPTQLTRMVTSLGWPTATPAVEVMYRSPVDIYIDEWVHDLLHAVDRARARRVVIDGLTDLQMAAVDDSRYREFMYSLTQRFSRQGVTLLTTLETQDPGSDGELSRFALTHLADNAISLNYDRDRGHPAASRSLAIIKTRASSHDTAVHHFTINDRGISISSAETA
jgi:circadian clock protein KaiC